MSSSPDGHTNPSTPLSPAQTLFEDHVLGVLVTAEWVLVRDKSYRVRDISKAKMRPVRAERYAHLERLPLFIFWVAFLAMQALRGNPSPWLFWTAMILAVATLVAMLALMVFLVTRGQHYTYKLFLQHSGQYVDALTLPDQAQASRIAAAINEAICAYSSVAEDRHPAARQTGELAAKGIGEA